MTDVMATGTYELPSEQERAFARCQADCLSAPEGFGACADRCVREHPEAARIIRERYATVEELVDAWIDAPSSKD